MIKHTDEWKDFVRKLENDEIEMKTRRKKTQPKKKRVSIKQIRSIKRRKLNG